MKVEMSITDVTKKPAQLKQALESGKEVRLIWREQKPNGNIILSAIVKKEDNS